MELINSPWAVDDDVPRGEKAHKSKSRIVISVSKCVIAFLSAAQISTTVLFLVKGFLLWSRIGYWAISAALFAVWTLELLDSEGLADQRNLFV